MGTQWSSGFLPGRTMVESESRGVNGMYQTDHRQWNRKRGNTLIFIRKLTTHWVFFTWMNSRGFCDDEENLAGRHWPKVFVFLLSFSFHSCLSNKNDIGEHAFDLQHLFQKGFLMVWLNAHSAVSRNVTEALEMYVVLTWRNVGKGRFPLNFWALLKNND